jgi:riboflavin synthase
MFTGIIESLGTIKEIRERQPSHHSGLHNDWAQIDQSVAHNGICLTVVSLGKNSIR